MKAKLIKAGRIVALLLAAVILLNETGFVFAQEGEKAKAPAVETEGEAQPGPAENGPAENGPTEDGSEEKGSEENDPEKKDPDEPGPQSPAASGAQTGGEEPDPAEGGAAEVPGTEVSETRVLEWKNESRTVVVTAEAEEAFPEGTSLHVTPVVEGDAYTGCMDLLYPKQEAEAEEKAAELYQLQFRNSDGEEADLTGPVRVTMTYSDGLSFAASEEQPLTVARLEEKSPENEGEVSWELIPVEAEIKEAENKEIENQETENQEAEHKSEGGIALFSAAEEPEAEKSEEEPALQVAFTVEESSRVVLYAAPRAAAVLSGTYLVRILNGSCTRDGKCTLQKETIEIPLADLGQDASNASNEPETQKSAILERIKTKLETEGYPEFVDVTELYVGTADIKGDKRITDSNKRVDSAKLYEVKSAYVSNSTVQAEYVVRGTLKTGAINDDSGNFPCDTGDMLNKSERWCFYVRATVNDEIKENLVATARTKDFITLRMFDYTEQINKHADLVVQATPGDNNSWQMNPNKVAGICDTQTAKEGFGFWEAASKSGFAKKTLYNPQGPGRDAQVMAINERTKGMVRPKLVNGMPVLNVDGENISLAYLFDPDTANRTEGASYLGEGDELFTLNGGTYSYDSGRNAAHYDESDHVFHVYNYKYMVDGTAGFMPYNFASKKAEQQVSEDRVNDYWFGMTATAVFLQPENGILPNNQEMTFEFSGDDDVWVFVDDVLVLDLGGVHAAIRGNINFANGQVSTWSAATNNPQRDYSNIRQKFIEAGYDADGINGKFKTNSDTFQDNSLHTLSFFYLERGAGKSNCKLEFNLLEPEFIALGKEVKWDEADPSLYKDDEILEKEKDREYPFKLWKKTATGEDGIPGLKYYGAKKNQKGELEFDGTEHVVKNDSIINLKGGEYAVFSTLSGTQYRIEEITPSNEVEQEKPGNKDREPLINKKRVPYYSQNYSGVNVEVGTVQINYNGTDLGNGVPLSGTVKKEYSTETFVNTRQVKGHREPGWEDSLKTNPDLVTTRNPESPQDGAKGKAAAGLRSDRTDNNLSEEYYITLKSRKGNDKLDNYVVFTNLLNPAYYQPAMIGKTVKDASSDDFPPAKNKKKEKLNQTFQFRVSARTWQRNADGTMEFKENRERPLAYGLYRLDGSGRLTEAYRGSASLHAGGDGIIRLKDGEYAVLEEFLGGSQVSIEEVELNTWDFETVTVQRGGTNLRAAIEEGAVLNLDRSEQKRRKLDVQHDWKYGYPNGTKNIAGTDGWENISPSNNQFLFENAYNPVLLKVIIGKEVEMETREGRRVNVSKLPSIRKQDFQFKMYYKEDDAQKKETVGADLKYAVISELAEDGTFLGKTYSWTKRDGSFELNPGEYAVFWLPYEAKWRVTEKNLQGLSYTEETVQAGHAIINTAESHVELGQNEKLNKKFEIPRVNNLFNVTTAGITKVADSYINGQVAPKKSMVLFESENQAVFTSLYNGNPKTGDDTPTGGWTLLAGIAAAGLGIGGIYYYRLNKKRRRDENDGEE